jgi:hypothetical protein
MLSTLFKQVNLVKKPLFLLKHYSNATSFLVKERIAGFHSSPLRRKLALPMLASRDDFDVTVFMIQKG